MDLDRCLDSRNGTATTSFSWKTQFPYKRNKLLWTSLIETLTKLTPRKTVLLRKLAVTQLDKKFICLFYYSH